MIEPYKLFWRWRMKESQKKELLELIDEHASFHGMYKEQLFKQNPDDNKWKLMKQIRDEKLAQIKLIIEDE
jgi:hypothetical protein